MSNNNNNNNNDSSSYTFVLGAYQRQGDLTIATNPLSDECKAWMNRGLVWLFAYNHDEAMYCLGQALAIDPDCVLAHVAMAYALGPNYNLPWGDIEHADRESILGKALHHLDCARQSAPLVNAKPVELALIHAVAARYPFQTTGEQFDSLLSGEGSSFNPYHDAFVEAMDLCFVENPDDRASASEIADILYKALERAKKEESDHKKKVKKH